MHIQFAELPVFDQERAKRFYTEKLGCEVAADAPMGKDGWRWIELKFPGAETRCISTGARTTGHPTSPSWCWWRMT